MIAPKIAAAQDVISKPLTTDAQILKTIPFTTSVNSPRVNTLSGNVRKIKIGLIKMFASPIKTAVIKAEGNDFI